MQIKLNLPFDYLYLVNQLKNYASPRDKITQLLKSGEIVRIKKGLYLSKDAHSDYLKEILSGVLYGPSYISMEYALAYYQTIPEQVKTITCITTQKPRTYQTEAGNFRYQHIRIELFHLGLEYCSVQNSGFWIASKEKALCDIVYFRGKNLSVAEIEEFLLEDMRIDRTELHKIDLKKMKKWQKLYDNTAIDSLIAYLQGVKQ